MALNIPVNLMSTAVPNNHASGPAETGTAAAGMVAPTAASARAGDTSPRSGGGEFGQGGADRQMLMAKLRSTLAVAQRPDGAEPTSILTAQTAPAKEQAPGGPAQTSEAAPRSSELDRYAPPDPLPTAPILLAAAAYAARRSQS
jgi:hypothetical protein